MRKLERSLTEGSESAFLLAVSVINNVTVEYRLEAFAILFCNAWELLLKGYLHGLRQNIFYKTKPEEAPRSIGLGDAIGRVFTTTGDPVRMNLERISELRDHAIHLCIPFVPGDIMGLFQAGVLNYCSHLREWTGRDFAARVPAGMLSLVFDVDPQLHSMSSAYVRRRMSPSAIAWVSNFQSSIRSTDAEIASNNERFFIPVNLKLALVRNPRGADIVISQGTEGITASIIEVPKDPDKTHPYRETEVVLELQEKCDIGRAVNGHDVRCVRKAHSTDIRPEFTYESKFGPRQYSQGFVDWLVREAHKDPSFFDQARAKARRRPA